MQLQQILPPSANAKPVNHPSTASGSGEDNSQSWENVPSDSLASSYPSINFPPLDGSQPPTGNQSRPREPLEGPSSSSPYYSRRGQGGIGGDGGNKGQSAAGLTLPPVAPPSVTLAIFDTTLSRRARLLALASSVAINLVLPFINGIMLGFGEIAAKSLFGWSGWREVAGGLGLRVASGKRNVRTRDSGAPKETPTLLTMP
jgi:Outer membrane protein TOM13